MKVKSSRVVVASLPVGDESLVEMFGVGRGGAFLFSAFGSREPGRVRRAVALLGWGTGGELHLADLLVSQAWLPEGVIVPAGQEKNSTASLRATAMSATWWPRRARTRS